MSERAWGYAAVVLTILLSVFSQIALKWRIRGFEALPEDPVQKIRLLIVWLFDPLIFSAYVAAGIAAIAWMLALSKMDLSVAYPFMSITFVGVLFLSAWMLGEPLSAAKILGVTLIVVGTIVASRG